MPTDMVMEYERKRRNRQAYESRNPNRKTRYNMPNKERPFIAWDGEGPQDAGYALLGNSLGSEICHPFLPTTDCLDFIVSTGADNPAGIHISYGFNYDVSMILKDLSWRALSALKHTTKTVWQDYQIEYVPRKWFTIQYQDVTVKIFDIVSFFATAYVPALENFNIGTPGEIALLKSEKARRSEFLWSEIEQIKPYMRLELRLMPILAESLRSTFLSAGFDVRSWHGPGGLARMALNRHGVRSAMSVTPPDVRIGSQYAFAGGRFEMFRAGHIEGKIYNADIRSAYPHFARFLPDLSAGHWRHAREFEPGKFGIYHIEFQTRFDPFEPMPLFRRHGDGEVSWPNRVSGWYHAPEAALLAEDSRARTTDALIFDEDNPGSRPFAWIEEYYRRRQVLKNAGSKAEYTFKLIINSVYGQLAQRAGWDKRTGASPRFHQLEWAGYITSACRALVYQVARDCGDKLISVDTDGLYSMGPIPLLAGNNLGDWELDEYDSGIFWQSGIYMLRKGDEWKKARTRGIPKGSYTADDMIGAMDRNEPLSMSRNVFTGFGLALNGQFDRLNTWTREPHEFVFGGQGKRYHNERGCRNGTTCSGSVHGLMPRPGPEPGESAASAPHELPWQGRERQGKIGHEDYVMFSVNNLDPDDDWVREYGTL